MSEPKKQQPLNIETHLTRDLGLTTALAIGVGTMIAAGIFTLSGLAIRNVGSAAVLSFAIAAVVALFTALTYCEFVSMYPRSGEGYLYARKTYPKGLSFVVGWALFLGYTSSCAFYIASFSSYFIEFVWHTPFEMASGIVATVLLILLNIKGTKESGRFQVIVTVVKVLLLCWFVIGGFGSVDLADLQAKFSTDIVAIGGTAGLVFITFFGFSAIAASAGEVKNPVKTIPRAIFISMGLVTVLYTAVVMVIIAADLTEYSEAAMGTAAKKFLGAAGGIVIIAGGLFSMISASNASIMAGSRVALTMSQLGQFPSKFREVHPKRRTPLPALLLVGAVIIGFALVLELESLAHFADVVLLTVLILVNAALIVHRRKYPDMVRPFKVPLVPILPAIGILANFYLLGQIMSHTLPVILAGSILLVGFLAYLFLSPIQIDEDEDDDQETPVESLRVAMEKSTAREKTTFKVLVPIANPDTVPQLIEMASRIAADRNGEVIALRVITVPDQLSPSAEDSYIEAQRGILEQAQTYAHQQEVPFTSLVVIGRRIAGSILETARTRNCGLILMGWKGYTNNKDKILGEVADAVVKNARTDLMLIKLAGEGIPKRILLPTAGGQHAMQAEAYTAPLARVEGSSITVTSVVGKDAPMDVRDKTNGLLKGAQDRLSERNVNEVHSHIIESDTITEGIITTGREYDAIVVGATRQPWFRKFFFGNIPYQIAQESTCTVILVKHYDRVKGFLRRTLE
jgi:amino acid transporter/nucleotide-binding universal stress UspA family protein